MNIKILLTWIIGLLLCLSSEATTTVIWQGSKQFSSWNDIVNISGNKFSQVKGDDLIRLSITANDNAQLQLSYGTNWTNMDGLGSLAITGDYEMIITSVSARQFQQGIHIKGVNYTLTAVTLISNDGTFETESEDLFGWNQLLTSGATLGERCMVGIWKYGGAGWYWPESVDLSSYGSINIQLKQPLTQQLTIQLFYNNSNTKSIELQPGDQSCKINLLPIYKKIYSLNMVSKNAQSVSLASVNLIGKDGQVVALGILSADNELTPLSVEYYNLSGMQINGLQSGINIIKTQTRGGRITIRKVIK